MIEKEINDLTREERVLLMEQFQKDKEVREDSNWTFLEGFSYCTKCRRAYPFCKGWHDKK